MDISSEAKKAGLAEPDRPVDEMTEEELALFRASFEADGMGFDGAEGIDDVEGGEADGSDEA